MDAVFFQMALAFFEGFALIVSPCILPILPIILSGSLTGSKSRPIGIIIGFITAFTLFTLFIRVITQTLHIDQENLRNISLALLVILGVFMISSYLSEKFNIFTQRLANVSFGQVSAQQEDSFFSGFIFGLLVGIIWTPCAGPILAAVIVQVVLQNVSSTSLLIVLMFAVGASLPMLLIAMFGRALMARFVFFKKHSDIIRKILGVLIIISSILLYYDPTFGLNTFSSTKRDYINQNSLINPLPIPYSAPKIEGITAWINSPPLSLETLKGKVVLIDFWTYSCINCIRTFPYIKDWYAKYHSYGLEIIGIHSPEFAFEHELNNVKKAVKKYGITYPVALDNSFVTWRNYQNLYWPAHYLINKEGQVVYTHFGEGEYPITENNIRFLLGLNQTEMQATKEKPNLEQTPETYFGYKRLANFSSVEDLVQNQATLYHAPDNLPLNGWALSGKWTIQDEKIIAEESHAKLVFHFNAAKVYAVMGVRDLPVEARIEWRTTKEKRSFTLKVNLHQLYTLVEFDKATDGEVSITALVPGLEIYTFTFG